MQRRMGDTDRVRVRFVAIAVVLLAACGHGSSTSQRLTSPSPPISSAAGSSVPGSFVSGSFVPGSSAASSSAPSSAVAAAGPPVPALIDHVRWTVISDGRRLQVFPTAAGRSDASPAGGEQAWTQVLAKAPTADTPGMHDQFLCHWNFARVIEPAKTSWNLEPWRPAVGYAATVSALCNPGGPEN
jgi:Protein of unknown function (DUF2599)